MTPVEHFTRKDVHELPEKPQTNVEHIWFIKEPAEEKQIKSQSELEDLDEQIDRELASQLDEQQNENDSITSESSRRTVAFESSNSSEQLEEDSDGSELENPFAKMTISDQLESTSVPDRRLKIKISPPQKTRVKFIEWKSLTDPHG